MSYPEWSAERETYPSGGVPPESDYSGQPPESLQGSGVDIFAPNPTIDIFAPNPTIDIVFGPPPAVPPQSPPPAETPSDLPPLVLEGTNLVCTPEQTREGHKLLAAIYDRDLQRVSRFTLSGRAGSGKTSIVRALAAALRASGYMVEFVAPTGKAALRLRQVSGEIVLTIHQRFFGLPRELCVCPLCDKPSAAFDKPPQGAPHYTCSECQAAVPLDASFRMKLVFPDATKRSANTNANTVIFCDEASMVSRKTGRRAEGTLLAGQVVVYVGDENQLPPIDDDEDKEDEDGPVRSVWAADFDQPTARLQTVHRQGAGSPILKTANRIADDITHGAVPWPDRTYARTPGQFDVYRDASCAQAAQWLADRRTADDEATLITWTHRERDTLNGLVRALRGHAGRSEATGIPVLKDDFLLVRSNISGYLNGEVIRVLEDGVWSDRDAEAHHIRHPVLRLKVSGPSAYGSDVGPQVIWILPDLLTSRSPRDHRLILAAGTKQATALAAEWALELDLLAKKRMRAPDLTKRFGSLDEYILSRLGYLPGSLLYTWWGECLTGHAAQGSEWNSVGIVNARGFLGRWKADVPWSRRWLYTAVTRARQYLSIYDLAKA